MINKLMFKIIFMKLKSNMDEFESLCAVISTNLIPWPGPHATRVMLMSEEPPRPPVIAIQSSPNMYVGNITTHKEGVYHTFSQIQSM